MAYEINYNDERFAKVESDKQAALNDVDATYNPMIDNATKYYDQQADAVKQWGETQKQNQQAQTDFAIEQIEQQKDQAHKDYLKEQSGAYVDWQKQSNDYGSNAEKMAESGLAHTGYSESSKVSMYNTYQNRVATAREAYNRAVLNYDNAIKDARLQNNSVLAEIAFNTLQKQLEIGLQGFQYKNQLVLEKANVKREVENNHYNRYENVLNHIYHEMSQAEMIRQYNESHALQQKQVDLEERKFEWQKKNSSVSRSSGGGGRSSSSGSSGSGGSGSAKVDKKSKTVSPSEVIDLGYGPISDEALISAAKKGYVEVDEKGKLTKTSSAPKDYKELQKALGKTSSKPTTKSVMDRLFPGLW